MSHLLALRHPASCWIFPTGPFVRIWNDCNVRIINVTEINPCMLPGVAYYIHPYLPHMTTILGMFQLVLYTVN